MLNTIKRILFIPNTILLTILFLFVLSLTPVLATNVLTNPSFSGNTTGWTLSNATYSSTMYQDTAGSVNAYAARKASVTATITQNSYFSNVANSTISLNGWWDITIGGNGDATMYVEVENQSNPGTWTQIWTSGTLTTATSWVQIGNVNVSSYFSTGSYRMRMRIQLNGGANAGAGINIWVDNFNLDVTPPYLTTGSTGTQVSTINQGSTNTHIGGAFTMVSNTGTINVNSIQISEAGTLNANSYLHNVKLYYETAATCTYNGTESQYGTTTSFSASEDATFTQTLGISTSQVCFYVVFDVDQSATTDADVEIEITNPSTDVSVSTGYTSLPNTTVSISGTTTVTATPVVSISLTTDGSINWGIMEAGTTKSTIDITDTEVVQSNSNVNIDLNIKSSNATGGTVNWSLGSTSSTDIFVYEHSSNSGSVWNKFLIPDSYYSFVSAMTPSSTQNLDLRITVPNVSSDFDQKTITVTIQAVQS